MGGPEAAREEKDVDAAFVAELGNLENDPIEEALGSLIYSHKIRNDFFGNEVVVARVELIEGENEGEAGKDGLGRVDLHEGWKEERMGEKRRMDRGRFFKILRITMIKKGIDSRKV